MSPFRSRIIPLLVAQLAWQSLSAQAQTAIDVASIPLAFSGGDTRIGIGYDSKNKVTGEVMQVLAGDDRTAWIGEAWLGRDAAGGIKLDYHWLGEGDRRVDKLFAAWDRNDRDDQKLSLGGGAEYQSWFWGAYASAGLTGRRDLGSRSLAVTETRGGSDPVLGDYLQDVTTTTTTRAFERAYDYGVGGRLGRFYDGALIRAVAGLDHEWGGASSSQTTASIGVEKFFHGSPHSILVAAAVSDRRGDFEANRHDQRVGVYWRYQFGKTGGAWQPTKSYRRVEDAATPAVQPAPQPAEAAAPVVEKKAVRVAESVSAETFFELNRSTLRPEAHGVLDELVARIKGATLDGTLRVTGHTCDLGPAAYNQKLSERRAVAVREYLVASGAVSADRVIAEGRGEAEPRYPNTRAERPKNRRCDIEFGIVAERTQEVPVATRQPEAAPVPAPAPRWHYEEETVAAAWQRRALRNPITHKREVDTYREEESTVAVVEGPRNYLNQAPVAVDDRAWWYGRQMPAIINVLANDHDPDGNPLTIVAVTNGSNGDVTIQADGTLRYMWRRVREGYDYFTYTISDGRGGLSTARVTLVVIDP